MSSDKAFKHQFNTKSVTELVQNVLKTAQLRPKQREEAASAACAPLKELELKDRVRHVSGVLSDYLPSDFEQASQVLLRSLPPAQTDDSALTAGIHLWPLCTYVERYGLEQPEVALNTLHALTQRFSCEFAIRPYIERYPSLAYERLMKWCRDPNLHVRRLASEGSRPRLPWGLRLQALVKDPAPSLPLLNALKADPEVYVRRSVANHLNDISKDHPSVAVETARTWIAEATSKSPGKAQLNQAPKALQQLVRRGLRGLVKAGDPETLSLFGYQKPALKQCALHLAPQELGWEAELEATLTFTSASNQSLLIDYAVHYQRANGELSPKVFKWTTLEARSGEETELVKRHPFRSVTTRKHYPGAHAFEVFINGQSVATQPFVLSKK